MTSREIIKANLGHNTPPRIGFNWPANRTTRAPRLNDMAGFGLGPSQTYKQRRWTEGNREFYDDEWGNLWVRMVGRSVKGEIIEPALGDWSKLDSYQLPDFDNSARFEHLAGIRERVGDKWLMAGMPGWIFDSSRYLRKMEIYFTDLLLCREEIDALHERVTDLLVRVIHKYAEFEPDCIFYCEDLGTQDSLLMSPALWRDVFRPHYLRLVGAAHEHGIAVFMHSCGYNWELVPDLIEVGIDAFQFDQPAVYDMPRLAALLKANGRALWSPVDIQKILPTGNRQLIEAEAQKMVDLFGGNYICMTYGDLNGIGVEPEWEEWAYQAFLRASGLDPDQVAKELAG